MPRLRKGEGKKFLVAAAMANDTECIMWVGSRNALGYGTTNTYGETLAHRAAYKLRHGECPSLLRHSCDSPGCVNPLHLLPGTHEDNMRDMVERGRQCKQEDRATKLDRCDVDFIRINHRPGKNRFEPGNTTQLALHFGVCREHILDVAGGRKW